MITALALLVALAPAPPNPENIRAAQAYSEQFGGFSFVVMHNGARIHEAYTGPGSIEKTSELASGTKSFTGVLALVAVNEGVLTSLDEVVSDTITEWKSDPRKRGVTVRDLLTLTSGVPGGTIGRPPSYADAVTIDSTARPGIRFQYGPAPFQSFGELMRRKLKPKGQTVNEFIEAKIFKPLGMSHGIWRKDGEGNYHLPSGAFLSAREWAKFGEMVRLDGKGVLKPGQVKTLFQGTRVNDAYGLSWWLPTKRGKGPSPLKRMPGDKALPQDIGMAAGAGGQRLFVIPSRGLTVVRQCPVSFADKFDDVLFLQKLLK